MESMSTRKLTLDIIKEYILANISSINNSDDEEIIIKEEEIKPKSQPIRQQTTIKDSFEIICNKTNKTEKFPQHQYKSFQLVNYLSDFLILNTISQSDINEECTININVLSFYYSILASLENTFMSQSFENKIKMFNSLISYLKKDIMIDGFKNHKYSTLKWKKNDIYNPLDKNILDNKLIRYVSDALHINLFVLDGDKINYYGGDYYVFKKIVVLVKYKEKYYLLCDNDNKNFIFKSNDFIKNILTKKDILNLIFCEKLNMLGGGLNISTPNIKSSYKEELEYTDRLNGYDIEDDTKHDTKHDTKNDNKNNQEDINKTNNININVSLIELQRKAKELNIDSFHVVNGIRKIKNKRELCDEINAKLN